ncbi:hypothetical protein L1I79_18115 [Strepomyces sp. STD 3.1]|uniref:hypothetical protein n=1 Tax=Streptomyces sp. NPDC058985 TaxID=3346684 RepID=UPI001F3109CF|nr:hypothetical protein [Streptomyces sp. STD 3.1]
MLTPPTPRPGSVPRRGPRPTRALTGAVCLFALAGTALAAAPAPAADTTSAPATESWRPDLSPAGGDDVNVRYGEGALRVRDGSVSPASLDRDRGYASAVLETHHVQRPVNRVTVDLDATVPEAADVEVDVRGRAADGTWTEWRRAAAGSPARLPRDVVDVQARLTLWNAKGEATAAVRALTLTADGTGSVSAGSTPTAAAFSARVYATREGLVGHTTANGHVIKANDHFVALPSRRALSPKGSAQYSVQVCGPARCETAPVWDVGPWNTHDDHWNPSTQREQWKDLPRGLPEAQAAYEDGYNGGRDEFGRQVANPAGIDLADGTFYNVGLNDNGWVTVTYLWTDAGGDTTSFPTWGTDVSIRQQASTGSTRVASLAGPTTVRVRCQVHGELVNYDGYSNDAWSYLPDYGGYVSNIFIDVADSWLPGVPTC